MIKRYWLSGPTHRTDCPDTFYYNIDSINKDKAVCRTLIDIAVGHPCRLIMAVVSDTPLHRPAHFILAGYEGIHDHSSPLLVHTGPTIPKLFSGKHWLLSAIRRRLDSDFNGARPLYVRLVPIVK